MVVKTVQLTEARGKLAGAMAVGDRDAVIMISTGGTVIRMPADGIRRAGRSTQGVIVMRLREGEQVSTLARVAESDANGDEDTSETPGTNDTVAE
jgi:DNA gyrase subunit A